MTQIQGKTLEHPNNYLDKVTYVPSHLDGDASKGEPGVIIKWDDEDNVFVLYSKGRTVQRTSSHDLVWG
jgi:hypothetical protein